MSKYKITVIDKEKVSGKINENEVVNEILKKEFFNWMSENGYGYSQIKEIFDGKRLSANEQNRFNSVIRQAKTEAKISITESIIFLEETYTKFKKIISVFDNETKFELKKELSSNFHIKLDENNLSQILE
jgi:hypothetical protein